MSIIFNGKPGMVLESSPHGNYLVVELSEKVVICGTFSNQFGWQENPDITSGFISFITYIGIDSNTNIIELFEWIEKHDGYFKSNKHCDESVPRSSKRVNNYPFELKVRGLTPDSVIELIEN
jgi:hypothetical protein